MGPLTADELEERARAALDPAALMRARLTLPLPAGWPDAGGHVVFLVYGREALPSALVRYEVRAPRHAVEVDVASGAARVLELEGGGAPLGEAGRARPVEGTPEEFAAARQAVVDLVAGRRTAAEARAVLAPYRRWLEAEPLIADDLRARPAQAAFLSWLGPE
jgi:hypothetical protein